MRSSSELLETHPTHARLKFTLGSIKLFPPMNWPFFPNPGNENLLLSNLLFMFLPSSRPSISTSSIWLHKTLTISHFQNLLYQRGWWYLKGLVV